MRYWKKGIGGLLVFCMLFTLIGCGGERPNEDGSGTAVDESFSYSRGIDENGYWEGITARDHVEMFEYQALPIPGDVYEVSDTALQAEVDALLAAYAVKEQVTDRPVEDGDIVNIDYVGSVDGVEFAGGTTGDAGTEVTIGVTNYIDDFLQQLIGHMPGDTFDVNVTFPENYGKEELNGKDAVFVTTINYIVNPVNPELTDDFVNKNLSKDYSWTTVDKMMGSIEEDLQQAAILEYIQTYLSDKVTVNAVPESLIRYLSDLLIDYCNTSAQYYSMGVDEYIASYMGAEDMDALLANYVDENEAEARKSLILLAVAEELGIVPTEEDVAAFFSDYLGIDDYSQQAEQLGMPYLKQQTLYQTVMDYIAEHAVRQN